MTPVTEVSNPYEAQKRMEKAIALADVLWPRLEDASPVRGEEIEVFDQLDAEAWKRATKAAGVNPPSDKTKELVRRMIEERVAARDADPFEGLS